jgi:hypothetical protein
MIIRFIVHYMGRRAASVFFATCPRSRLGQVVKKEVHIKAAKHSLSPRVNHLYRIPFAAQIQLVQMWCTIRVWDRYLHVRSQSAHLTDAPARVEVNLAAIGSQQTIPILCRQV